MHPDAGGEVVDGEAAGPLGLAIAVAVAWLIAWQISRTAYDERFGRTVITTDTFDPLLWAIVGRHRPRSPPGIRSTTPPSTCGDPKPLDIRARL